MENQRTFKRTNWTTEEVIELLEGFKLSSDGNHSPAALAWMKNFNDGIDDAKENFYDFIRPETESGAMTYCVEDKQIYHIGPLLPR